MRSVAEPPAVSPYGHLDATTHEYVIRRPDTPTPWINSWPSFEARRAFRGVTYEIRVRRDGPGNAVSLLVDGRPIAGSVVLLPPPATSLGTVDVTLR